ncbi:hypothetical protein BJX70DRAFT_386763 [Aspergillus crustosus]
MAYQFFAKAHQAKRSFSASPPLPQHSSSPPSSRNAHGRPPKYPPPMVASPPSTPSAPSPISIAARLKPPTRDPSLQLPAYPHPIQPGYTTPHEHVTIEPVNTAHIPSLSRIMGLLLPIRYPNSFYTTTVTDPVIASVSRVAIYHDHPVAAAPTSGPAQSPSAGANKVIGGIRCRLERISQTISEGQSEQEQEPTNLYIQTLHLLSPYRGYGVAASLLNSLLYSSPPRPGAALAQTYKISDLVKHYNIRSVTAHVHEANEDGLKWYISRGFQVEEGIVENYYRRLNPSGARIVRLNLQWDDSGDNHQPTEPFVEPLRVQTPSEKEPTPEEPEGDDDWEKVDAEDELDPDELGLGVHSFSESRLLDVDESVRKKRKTDEASLKR